MFLSDTIIITNDYLQYRRNNMKKNFKRITILTLLIVSIFSLAVNNNAIAQVPSDKDNGVHLILDSVNYNSVLPKHFRKTTDLAVVKDNKI